MQGFDAVHVNQGNVNNPIRVGIDNDDPILANGEQFRVAHLIVLTVGKPHLKWLKRLPIQPFPNRFCVHAVALLEGLASLLTPKNYNTAAGVCEG